MRTTGAAAPVNSVPVTDAAQVTTRFGWALRGGRLLVTRDDGTSWGDITPAGLDRPVRAAYVRDARTGWAATAAPGRIQVARTGDGGRTWHTTTLHTSADVASLRLAFGSARTGGLLVQRASGSNFSLADFYASGDGGATWRSHPAPAAGSITITGDGRTWLAGGVNGSALFTSGDLGTHWADATPRTGAKMTAVGLPPGGPTPVAVEKSGRSELDFVSAARQTGSVPLTTPLGQGARPAIAQADGNLVIAESTGGRLYRTTPSGVVREGIRPRGLPSGVTDLSFADANTGWALASTSRCATGKRGCTTVTTVLATTDGGRTWRQILGA